MFSRHLAPLWFASALLAAGPASVLQGAGDRAIQTRAIEKALSHPNLEGADVGVEIRSVASGRIVFARGARRPLIVASNNKLVTTASALHHLGAGAKLQTRLYAVGNMEEGVLHGDLAVRGGGDPCLSGRFYEADPLESLAVLARAAVSAGIQRVTGSLLLDDTIFDREFVAPGWPEDQLNRGYCAPVSGLSLLENLAWIEVAPAARPGAAATLSFIPKDLPFFLKGEVRTTNRKKENIIAIARPDAKGRIRISGRTGAGNPPSRFSVPVRDPPAYFGALFLKALERSGVRVEGGLSRVEEPLDYEEPPCRLLGTVSHDLEPAVIVTNKESLNHFAEQLFKLSGWKVSGKGTFASGKEAARRMFRDLGLTDLDDFSMVDGSGLSRNNTFSAHTLVSLLAALYAAPIRDAYLRSLPIAGVDGSLARRMKEEPCRSRVRAKTGWIREVSALSGYIQSLSGEVFAFSILFNRYRGSNAVMKGIQDRICRIVVDG